MVALLQSGKSIKTVINYHEQKVAADKAKLIGEGWYGKDLQDMTYEFKVQRLQDLAARNTRSLKSAFHLSLNFSNNDQLNEKKLFKIAQDYLDRIGLRKQPFLVYQHFDAGHPHIHVVSVRIRPSGDRISIHEPGHKILVTAQREIEKKYGLESPGRKHKEHLQLTPPGSRLVPVQYGKCETGAAISNVVYEVLNRYKVTSLPEFDAVLSQFNIQAEPGTPGTKTYLSGSVFYRATHGGRPIGHPISAGNIEGFPGRTTLEALFAKNLTARADRKERLVNRLDAVLSTGPTEAGFLQALKMDGISVILQHSDHGRLDGVTYIDNLSGVAVDGHELGPSYDATGLVARVGTFNEVLKKLKVVGTSQVKAIKHLSSSIPDPNPNRIYHSQARKMKQGLRL